MVYTYMVSQQDMIPIIGTLNIKNIIAIHSRLQPGYSPNEVPIITEDVREEIEGEERQEVELGKYTWR